MVMKPKRERIREAIIQKIKIDRENREAKLVDKTVEILRQKHGLTERQVDRNRLFEVFRDTLTKLTPDMANGLTIIATSWKPNPTKPMAQKLAETCEDMLNMMLERNIDAMEREGIIERWRQAGEWL